KIERFIPFGHSVGGAMAICCGARMPETSVAIITEAAQMFAEDQTLREIAAAKSAYQQGVRFAKLKNYHGEKTDWVMHAWTDTWLSAEFATWNVRGELEGLRCPMLVLHGDQDEFGSVRHVELARQLSGNIVVTQVLKGIGHVPHKEHPDSVLHAVSGFLSNC